MSDNEESSSQPKKHKVIHWNPEDDDSSVNSGNSGLKITIAIMAFVLIAALGGGYMYIQNLEAEREQNIATSQPNAPDQEVQEFMLRSQATQLFASTQKNLEAAQQVPPGHPTLRNEIIGISKLFSDAEDAMKNIRYERAIPLLEKIDDDLNAFNENVEIKQTGQDTYNNFIAELDLLKRTKHLNEKAYDEAFAAASAGKQFLDTGSFKAAKIKLDEATTKIGELKDSRKAHIRKNLAEGMRHITQGNGEAAKSAFTEVLSIDPANDEALRNLDRAPTAEEVFNLLTDATLLEDGNELEEALVKYERAFAIDANSAKAQQGVSRVRRNIENRDFNFHYGSASQAINNNEYQRAIDHYKEALKIFPSRTDIEGSIQKAQQDKRNHDIVTMTTEARALEEAKDWEGARNIYRKLSNIEPELDDAKNGLLRTGKMIRSILRYEKLIEVALAEAGRLEYQEAKTTFDEAMRSKPQYVELSDEANRLREFLIAQSTPVQIAFISDMNTWVSIQGPSPQKPKKLKEDVFALLPGRYYVIGRKKGYEDVRFPLQVRANQNYEPLTVICNVRRDN
ncbi:MAG: hypothetical protein AAGB46_11795 [Verrucomicrobiota bacterium]